MKRFRKAKPAQRHNYTDLRGKSPGTIQDVTAAALATPRFDRRLISIILCLLVAVGIAAFTILSRNQPGSTNDQIPPKVQAGLNITVYSPRSGMLPEGYQFDVANIRRADQIVIYQIKKKDQAISVTQQSSPGQTKYDDFLAASIPLRVQVQTDIGTASLGAINNNSIATILTNKNTWILITAPASVSQADLTAVVKSLAVDAN